MHIFLLIWFGQLISLLGSGLTGFSLGLWVLSREGSVTRFALISMFTVLPGVLMSPVAGALVDRWDRRLTMLASEAGGFLATVAMAALLATGHLETWHIYLTMSLISTLAAFQWPAYTAATTLLVPKQHLANASGMVQLAHGVAKTAAPVLAGLLMSVKSVGIEGVLAIDAASYLFAAITLLAVRIPHHEQDAANRGSSILSDVALGWTYLRNRPGLLGLLSLLGISNFMMGLVIVLVTPLVLSFADAKVLGMVMSTAGVGMFAGSVAISVWGGPRRRMDGVLGFLLLSGLALLPAGLPASAALIGAGAFLFMFGVPLVNGCSQAILQAKVAPDVQGRVFSLTGMVASASLPLAFVMAGPLADHVFEPLLAPGGPLAGTLGTLVGIGPGRGIALLLMILGAMLIATAAGGFLSRLRRMENRLPDALGSLNEDARKMACAAR